MSESTRPRPTPVCPHCVRPIGDRDDFCPNCGGPVTSFASIDPMGQIYATGYAYRQAVHEPRLIVVLGVWLILGPQLFGALALLADAIFWTNGPMSGSAPLMRGGYIVVLTCLLAVYAAVIGKVTLRYRAADHQLTETT